MRDRTSLWAAAVDKTESDFVPDFPSVAAVYFDSKTATEGRRGQRLASGDLLFRASVLL
jgi:hypothetical protein